MRAARSMAFPSHDMLSRLARDDPQAFENLRSELIEDFIVGSSVSEERRTRLRRLQFRVDAIRHRSRSPLGALLKVYALMWDNFINLNQALQDLRRPSTDYPRLVEPRTASGRTPLRSARIIAFKPRSANKLA